MLSAAYFRISFALLSITTATLATRAVAQTEPVIKMLPVSSAVVGTNSVQITVIGCAYESGDNMIDLTSFQVRMWHTENSPGYVDVTSDFSLESASAAECDFYGDIADEVFVKWVGTLPVNANTGPLSVDAKFLSLRAYTYQIVRSYSPPSARFPEQLIANQGFVDITPGSTRTERFTLTNIGTHSTTYVVSSPTCTGAVFSTGCTRTTPDTIHLLAAAQSATIQVQYTASGSTGARGLMRVRVHPVALGAAHNVDSATTEITTVATPAVGVQLAGNAPGVGDYLDRSACVTIALAPNVASECGDLRVTHPIVGVRSMGRSRAPVLLYNSAHARPRPLILANVRMRADIALPSDSVTASVHRIDTVPACGSRKLSAAAWAAPGETRRVLVPFSDCPTATGMYRYRVRIVGSNQTHESADTGRLFVVNRSTTRFGAGWWIAGLEQLSILSSTELLWIGGDGSVRRYLKTGSVWRVPTPYGVPDSITKPGSSYIRHTPNHARVFYSSSGRHDSTRTIDRQVTRFVYAGSTDSLLAIQVPLADTAASLRDSMEYRLRYASGKLDSIIAPGNRVTRLLRSGSTVTGIIDPDGDTTSFQYSAAPNANEMWHIRDRAGSYTAIVYAAVTSRISVAIRPLGVSYSMTASESRGVTPTILDSAYTLINGPRPGVADDTRLWTNAHGAVVRSRAALGQETKITYSSQWPGLPQRSASNTGVESIAFYNSRGLVDSVRVPAPYGNLSDTSLTRYRWHSALNRVTSVRSRVNSSTIQLQDSVSYNSDSTVAWQQRGSSGSTRQTFSYSTMQSGAILPLSTTLPGAATTTYAYDRRGNLRKSTSPLGFVSLVVNDALGRPVTSYTPRDTGSLSTDSAAVVASGLRSVTHYNVMNRDTMQVTVGPRVVLSTGRILAADTVRLRIQHDAVGRVVEHTRMYSRTSDTLETALYALNPSKWVYDSLGRTDSTIEAGRGWRKFTYDAAGNVTSVRSPRSTAMLVTFSYDAANRLTRRITPSVSVAGSQCQWYGSFCLYTFPTLEGSTLCIGVDSAFFTYNSAGQMRGADNNWARIRREYFPNGSLKAESQIVRTYETEAPNPCGPGDRHAKTFTYTQPDWTQHVYQLSYTYDLMGRRTTVTLPTLLNACSGPCVQRYGYAATGELNSLWHPGGSSDSVQTTFTYDGVGRLTGTYSPGSVSVTRGYDSEGRVSSRSGTGISDSFEYDAGGRVVAATVGSGSVQLEYSGLGALQRATGLATGLTSEDYRTDALGSILWSRDPNMIDGINRTKINTYNSATGQLVSTDLGTPGVGSCPLYNESCHPNWYVYEFGQSFDAAGNVASSFEIETDGSVSPAESTPTETRQYYDASDRLMYTNTTRGWITYPGTGGGTFSEYRYDALGKRVLTRTRRLEPTCASPCDAFIERTVYDGDQVLMEIRTSGQIGASPSVLEGEGVAAQGGSWSGWTDPQYPKLFGIVYYTHGPGIDEPVHILKRHVEDGIWRGFTPLSDWRGSYWGGRLTNGSSCTTSACPTEWESDAVNAYGRELGVEPVAYATWYGSLVRGRKDASGLTYLRNRYYNPATGQFTQLDPIGLAGGLNSYGFAAGDPINYSDPFGLCPKGEICRRYIFAHLSHNAAVPGTTLEPNKIFATTGNTGRSEAPHLHYETGDVDANGNYTPDRSGGPEKDGCPLPSCSMISSRPQESRTTQVAGETEPVTRAHQGTDISVPAGTPVVAPKGGVVQRAGWQDPTNHKRGFGLRVEIDVVVPRGKQ